MFCRQNRKDARFSWHGSTLYGCWRWLTRCLLLIGHRIINCGPSHLRTNTGLALVFPNAFGLIHHSAGIKLLGGRTLAYALDRLAAGLAGFPRIEGFLDVPPEFPLGNIQGVFQVSAFVRHLPDLLGLLQDSNGIAVVRLAMQAERRRVIGFIRPALGNFEANFIAWTVLKLKNGMMQVAPVLLLRCFCNGPKLRAGRAILFRFPDPVGGFYNGAGIALGIRNFIGAVLSNLGNDAVVWLSALAGADSVIEIPLRKETGFCVSGNARSLFLRDAPVLLQ